MSATAAAHSRTLTAVPVLWHAVSIAPLPARPQDHCPFSSGRCEMPSCTTEVCASARLFSIVDSTVEENDGATRIRCADILCTTDYSSGVLIEVSSRPYVWGNHFFPPPHTVDLNSQQHWHTDFIQLSCELYDCSTAETLPVKDNACRTALGVVQFAIAIAIKARPRLSQIIQSSAARGPILGVRWIAVLQLSAKLNHKPRIRNNAGLRRTSTMAGTIREQPGEETIPDDPKRS